MGGAYGTYEEKEKYLQYFGSSNLKVREHSNGLDIDGRIILTLTL